MKKLFYLCAMIIAFLTLESCTEDNTALSIQKEQEFTECESSIQPLDNSKAVNGFIEGDIIPDKGYLEKGFVSSELDRRWENNIVPYYYAGEESQYATFKDSHQKVIDSLIKNEVETKTNLIFIKFESREALLESYEDGVMIVGSFMGSSHLGRQGGIQMLSLTFPPFESSSEDYPEEHKRTTVHEIGHLVGLHHEHTRPDRDDYIVYYPENVYDAVKDQFEIRQGLYCSPYDIYSVMHYGSDAGVKEEGTYSMTTLEGEEIIPSNEFTELDIYSLDLVYPRLNG